MNWNEEMVKSIER